MATGRITRSNPYTPTSGQFAGQTFYSERSYRDALARAKGFSSYARQRELVGQHGWRRWSIYLAENGQANIVNVDIRNRRSASKLAAWDNAAHKFVYTGDDRDLREFRGKGFRTQGQTYTFFKTDADLEAIKAELERRHSAGDSGIEYASTPV